MNRRAFILAAMSLSGCASVGLRVAAPAAPAGPAGPAGQFAELEPLYRAEARRDSITIGVASNGCTTKADFAFHVERKGEAVTLAFGRRRIDTCKSFAAGRADLTFTWEELGVPALTPVFLLNPVTAWTGPGGQLR